MIHKEDKNQPNKRFSEVGHVIELLDKDIKIIIMVLEAGCMKFMQG